jgi:hypothetical protein
VLSIFEWLAKYGFIDIIFGLGVMGFLARLIQKVRPSNYDHFHIDASVGGPVAIPRAGNVNDSFSITIRNAGQTNIYIARAYFRPTLRHWKSLWLLRTPTRLKIHPQSSRIADKDAFELKFAQAESFTEYEALVKPGSSNGVSTWLPLEQSTNQEDINKRQCGKIYIEYATAGRQGVHVVRL